VRIGEGCRLVNGQGRAEADGPGFYIRDGIIIVPKNAEVAPGTIA
jgi:glucose-1-phosphate adenylyltransferase